MANPSEMPSAPFDAVAHVLEGEALITIAGVPVTVPAGDMVLMPANQPHAVAAGFGCILKEYQFA